MWTGTTLGEICKMYQPKTISTKEMNADGEYVVYGANGIIGKYDKYNHEEPQLLITCRGATCGSVNVSTPFSWINGNAMVIKPDTSKVSLRYMEYLFKGGIDLSMAITGAAQPQITRQSLNDVTFFYPPLIEQQRIVAKLDKTFAEIEKMRNTAKKKQLELNNFYQSTLTNLLTNNRSSWNSAKLGEVSTLITRGISPKYTESGGVCVLNQKCIRNHLINYSLARRHNFNIKKIKDERFIRRGDVLINSTGQGTLGRVAQVREEPKERTTVDSHITIVRPKKELFSLNFFGYALIKIENNLKEAGLGASGQTELPRSKVVNEFNISYPLSHDEQERVSINLDKILSNLETLNNINSIKIINYEKLRLAILRLELQNKAA